MVKETKSNLIGQWNGLLPDLLNNKNRLINNKGKIWLAKENTATRSYEFLTDFSKIFDERCKLRDKCEKKELQKNLQNAFFATNQQWERSPRMT